MIFVAPIYPMYYVGHFSWDYTPGKYEYAPVSDPHPRRVSFNLRRVAQLYFSISLKLNFKTGANDLPVNFIAPRAWILGKL